MELNREQIVKALECCDGTLAGCKECPNYNNRYRCTIEAEARTLIKSQEKRIAELEEKIEGQKALNLELAEMVANAHNDIVRNSVRKMQSEIKERCIKGGIYPAFVASTIDQIAKEMLEGITDGG